MDKYPFCTIELQGRTFQAFTAPDDSGDAPWDSCDGHGPVSDWRRRESKRAGELVLCEDRGSCRFYDFAAAVKLARKDGWDTPPYKQGTPGERAERAATADFKFLREYCRGDWYYVGVIVECDGERDSLWGIESCAGEYLKETAHELAQELARQMDDTALRAQVARAFL